MIFKNSVKLLISNFSTVWKILLYKIIVVVVTIGLFCVSLGYLNTLPLFRTFSDSLISFFTTCSFFSSLSTTLNSCYYVLQLFVQFIEEFVLIFPFLVAYLVLLFFFLLPYLWHLSDIPTSETLFGFMTSQAKFGFTSSFIRNILVSNNYSWTFTILILPFNVIFMCLIAGFVTLAKFGGIVLLLVPFLILLLCLAYYSLRTALLSGWASAITTTNSNTFSGLQKCFSAISRRFLKVFSTSLVYVFLFITLFAVAGFLGLAIMLPLYSFIVAILGMVIFFENQGMRYYVDIDTIINPKRLEQTEKLKKLKYFI